MRRRARSMQGGLVYHVLNRSNGRVPLFRKDHGQPFGSEAWCERIIRRLGLESTVRPPGRPKEPD